MTSPANTSDRETGTVERLVAERDEALAWISDATKMITEVTGGGSELFIRKGEVYRADLDYCKRRIRERHTNIYEQMIREIKARKSSEAKLATAREALPDAIHAMLCAGSMLAEDDPYRAMLLVSVDRLRSLTEGDAK